MATRKKKINFTPCTTEQVLGNMKSICHVDLNRLHLTQLPTIDWVSETFVHRKSTPSISSDFPDHSVITGHTRSTRGYRI